MIGAPALDRVLAHIERHGPIGVDDLLALALYDPEVGFYAGSGGRAGTVAGDFLTSPEVGPLFGQVVAGALDAWWDDLGRPDPFVVVDAGAGPGTLARTVAAARPRCAGCLTYVLVERSARQRRVHAERLALTEPSHALPASPAPGDDGPLELAPPLDPGSGPRWCSLAQLPAVSFTGVVIANELLDNLPFRLLERGADGWSEVRLAAAPGGVGEILVPARDGDAALARALAPAARPGDRLPVQADAARWLQEALGRLQAGRVVVLDYADHTAALAARPWEQWLRTYRGHERGAGPWAALGGQDVTCEVAIDQLARIRPPAGDRTQAEFLRDHGIDALVEAGREQWRARAHVGDLAALTARSRLREADALLDPAGLGAFRVLEWVVPSP